MFTGEATGSKLGIIAGASHPVQSCPRYSTGASGQSRSPVGPILLVHQILLQMPEAASWFLTPPMLRCSDHCCLLAGGGGQGRGKRRVPSGVDP